MTPSSFLAGRPLRVCAALAAALLGAPRLARAEGFRGSIEPTYSHVDEETTSVAGQSTSTTSDSFTQRYRLAFDRTLAPELRFDTGGVFEDQRSWTNDEFRQATVARYFATVNVGNPTLGGALGYDRNRRGSLGQPALISDTYRLSVGWRPEGLPTVDLLLNRFDRYDEFRAAQDSTTSTATLSTIYSPVKEVELRYSARYLNPVNHLSGTETTVVGQTARIAYNDTLLDRRARVSASYTVDTETTETRSRGAGGTISTLQPPTGGLSAVENFPATAERIVLAPTPSLIDGNTAASTGINLGFSRTLAGDTAPRHFGVEFPNRLTAVNNLYVYVDVPLTAAIAASLSWAAYQSDDNLVWTALPIVRPVAFDLLLNRFEIAIPETRARYLKVVTRPIPAITTDTTFSNVFVTELQTVHAVPAPVGTRESSRLSGQFQAAGNYRIHDLPTLVYDSSLVVGHTEKLSDRTYFLVNGLSVSHRFGPRVAGNARADRTDNDPGTVHESSYGVQGSLIADALPTLALSLGAGSRWTDTAAGTGNTNSVTALGRALFYEGLDLSSSASYSFGRGASGVYATAVTLNASSSIQPHPRLSFNTSYGYSRTEQAGQSSEIQQWTAAGASNPIGSVQVSAGVTRSWADQSSTSANVAVGWSPLAGGALQLSLSYNRSLESAAANTVSQQGSAALRWNVRPRTSFETTYTIAESDSTAIDSNSRALSARLIIGI